MLLYICLVLIAYLFPDRTLPQPTVARAGCTCASWDTSLFVVGAAGDPESFHEIYPGRGPAPDAAAERRPRTSSASIGLLFVVASLVGTVVCARVRLRDADRGGAPPAPLVQLGRDEHPDDHRDVLARLRADGEAGTITLLAVCLLGSVIPVVIGIAILRTRLFDIELVLSRTVTYAALTVGVVGIYALVLWGADALVAHDSVAGLVAVGIVAVVVQPAHGWLRRRVERMVYGDRNDPGLALRRLADRVEGTTDPAGVIDSVTGSVVDALRVQRAWIERDTVPDGTDDDRVVRVPLVHRGERLGDLAVEVPRGRSPRHGGPRAAARPGPARGRRGPGGHAGRRPAGLAGAAW